MSNKRRIRIIRNQKNRLKKRKRRRIILEANSSVTMSVKQKYSNRVKQLLEFKLAQIRFRPTYFIISNPHLINDNSPTTQDDLNTKWPLIYLSRDVIVIQVVFAPP